MSVDTESQPSAPIGPQEYAVLRARIALHMTPPDIELAKRYLRDVPELSDDLVEVEGLLARAGTSIRAGEALCRAAREKLGEMETKGGAA